MSRNEPATVVAKPEVELAHVLVLTQHAGRLVHHDLARLEDVAVVRDRECHVRVLLHEQHRGPLSIDLNDQVADLLHDERCEPERRFVEQQQPRLRHEGAPDGEHLLLPAGEVASDLRAPFSEHGEQSVDALEALWDDTAVVPGAPRHAGSPPLRTP
jgi:hypothetical protein